MSSPTSRLLSPSTSSKTSRLPSPFKSSLTKSRVPSLSISSSTSRLPSPSRSSSTSSTPSSSRSSLVLEIVVSPSRVGTSSGLVMSNTTYAEVNTRSSLSSTVLPFQSEPAPPSALTSSSGSTGAPPKRMPPTRIVPQPSGWMQAGSSKSVAHAASWSNICTSKIRGRRSTKYLCS